MDPETTQVDEQREYQDMTRRYWADLYEVSKPLKVTKDGRITQGCYWISFHNAGKPKKIRRGGARLARRIAPRNQKPPNQEISKGECSTIGAASQ